VNISPPQRSFVLGGGEGEVPTTKAFSMQRGAQKSKGKNLPILYTWWKLDVMFCPHFRSRGILSQEQGFVSYYFFLSFFIIIFCELDVTSKGFVFFPFFF
jgi:hypothetical protein